MGLREAVLAAGWVVAAAVVGWQTVAPGKCAVEAWTVPEGVAATVDGQEVLWEDVELDVLGAMAAAGLRYEGPAADRNVHELRLAMRERAVERALLEQEGRRRGYTGGPRDVQEALDRLRSQVPEGTLLDRLLRQGRFEQVLRRRAASAVVVDRLLSDLRRQSAPPEEELRAYYRENLDRFREPEAAYFRQVLTQDRASAVEAARRLRAGEPPESVGQHFAPDRPGFERGAGELRMFRGDPDPREPVLFRLRPGQVSDPVELPGGRFAVLRLERTTPARQLGFPEVRDQVQKTLAARKFNEAVQRLVKMLRDRARVVYRPLPAPTPATPGTPGRPPSPGP
ncbi:MAG: peptidylprolyl isomerase [Armatimonadota bacterium]|nr:peptidylprolyl isomerase [Armatimonadota bacterium]MDR7417242.1 peptidylprolyl isomerase [Armatimonadota bacterium]